MKPIIESHGGRFEMILEPYIANVEGAPPGEIHLLSFKNPQGLKDFRKDSRTEALRLQRGDIVDRVDLIPCHQMPLDEYFGDSE
ncbi:MAG: hypothetical protein QNL04_13175 [SAR324 cluster bacterium]|nr:hypothetical protein [SAR324 cluster bacterium]